ncbi:polar amino acid transport system substrate-binding protein [Microbacterium natoriense]|uniref:Polar amino acid transport system substrate-binding protein n=1 Tax=Microbacterium natoriense TaxID=284570 RepID=A0AAW8ETC8_9MICO|nr:ABC transporter substrate-binding protein [Microbacterium natoriense]MDQ0646174.1 polar amino acid transport system substrate-binding protein [Microbacterium natoriense]
MPRTLRRAAAAAIAVVAAVTLAACAGTPSSSSTAADGELQTVTAGKLTIATGEPDYEPWFVDDDPSNGKGFEGAVANAVAEQLGFDSSDIEWVRTGFDAAIAPGPKDWDINIQQFSVTDERKNAVDFSSPYYTTTQAVVALNSSSSASATTIDELKKAKVGVAAGTTSYTVAKEQLGDANLSVFNTVDDVVLALQAGQIDAMITDLPGAFYITGAVVDDSTVTGQFESSDGGDEFAVVLPKGSALTKAVSDAVDALREDSTLDELQQKWLSDAVDVPVLK